MVLIAKHQQTNSRNGLWSKPKNLSLCHIKSDLFWFVTCRTNAELLSEHYSSHQHQTIHWKMGTKRMVTNCQERNLCNPFFSLLKLKNKPTHQSCMCCWRILDTFSGRFCLSFEFVPLLFYSRTLSTIYSASAGLFSLLSSNYDKLHVTVVFAVQHWSNIEKCEVSKPNLLYMLPRWLTCFLC